MKNVDSCQEKVMSTIMALFTDREYAYFVQGFFGFGIFISEQRV